MGLSVCMSVLVETFLSKERINIFPIKPNLSFDSKIVLGLW